MIRVRLGALCRGLAGLVAIGALTGGVPYVLVRFIGWPLPRHVPSWHATWSALSQHDLSDTAILDILAIALWLCWAVLVLAFVAEAVALARSRAVGRLPLAGYLQGFAGALLGTVVLTFAASFARTGGSGVGLPRAAITTPVRPPVPIRAPFGDGPLVAELTAAVTIGPAPNGSAPNGLGLNGHAASLTSSAADGAREIGPIYVVRDDDTLWGIAERELGDPLAWRTIFELNEGVPQADGGALENPHWIYPGWRLRLPTIPSPAHTTTAPPTAGRTPSPTAMTTAPSRATEPTTTTPTTTTPTIVPSSPAPPHGPVAPSPATPSTVPDRTDPTTTTNGRPGDGPGPATGNPGATSGERAPGHEPAVELSATDRVGGALVVAILGALVALRLRRRQRYRPRAPRPGRRLGAPPLTPALRDLLVIRDEVRADVASAGRVHESVAVDRPPLTGLPSPEAFVEPDRIEVGTSATGGATRTVELALGEWPGLVIGGVGAEATLRAWLAALLARSGPYNVEITTTRTCAERFFPGVDFPSIWPLDDVAAVLRRVESELVGRTRQLEVHDLPDAAAFRATEPQEPFPFFVVLLDELPTALSGRFAALSAQAARLGATTLVLGTAALDTASLDTVSSDVDEAGLPTLSIGEDGFVLRATPRALAEVLRATRCFSLGSDEAGDLLAPIVAVHNYGGPGDEPAPEDRQPEDREPEDREPDEPDDAVADHDGLGDVAQVPVLADATVPDEVSTDADEPAPDEPVPEGREDEREGVIEQAGDAGEQGDAVAALLGYVPVVSAHRWPHPRAMTVSTRSDPPIHLRVLGAPEVEAFGSPVDQGLRESAFELLAWFALRPDGATIDVAAESLWPGAAPGRGRDRFWTALGNARSLLGRPPGTKVDAVEILVKSANRYVPDAAVLDVDLWHFHDALRRAERASDDAASAAALAAALAAYSGDLYDGAEGLWSEEAREDLHRRALDAAITLAELHEANDRIADATAALEWAIALDPICEEATRRLIMLLGRLGRFDQARRCGDVLKGRLAEADLDPGQATIAVLVELRKREQIAERRRARDEGER